MILLALPALPALAGLVALVLRSHPARRLFLMAVAAVHGILVLVAAITRPEPLLSGWLGLDAAGLLFLGILSLLFLAVAVYGAGYLAREDPGTKADLVERGAFFSNVPEARFTACLLFFLATMTLVCLSQHLGLLWVAIEATTLASAPLIYFHRHHRSLEATWKYLLICSVGIALALLGNLFLSIAAAFGVGSRDASMVLPDLIHAAAVLHPGWLEAAFVLLLVGYGTKAGLAPLHTWLPDAHSEAPSLVSALLSGALLNCAFLGILRALSILEAAGLGGFGRSLLVALGLASMLLAASFLLGQRDYKRLLAYSSVEHMGILALGVGIGGLATYGAMLHAMSHSAAKALLFLVSGNLLTAYRSKAVAEVSGAARALPVSGGLWLLGLLAITGIPPFGTFLSEWTILRGALGQGQVAIAVIFLALLAVLFVGMATPMLQVALGPEPKTLKLRSEPLWAVLPPIALAGIVTLLGIWIAPPVEAVAREAARLVGGG